MSKKVDRFKEGLALFDISDEVAYAHDWDFSDSELGRLSGIKRCPKCGAPVEVDDGVIHCSECEWTYS